MITRDLTIGQVATLINVASTILSNTLGVSLVLVLVYIMRNPNPAIDWSVVAGRLHSSLWPTLLRADSAASSSDARVKIISFLTFSGTILLTVAAIVTPLGLKDGPIATSDSSTMSAAYLPDSSPIGLATPSRNKYTYGGICGANETLSCSENGDPTVIIDTFSSTSQGPFHMQFRRYHPGITREGFSTTNAEFGIIQSLVLRNDTFAIEGLIVDMNNPGVGLWNHTLPSLESGGTWSEDVLWLEPVTSCINTNITLDYEVLASDPLMFQVQPFNLTDRGGLANLTPDLPEYSRNGQHIDLYAHAYKGAVLSNFNLMVGLNITRNEAHIGMPIPLDFSQSFFHPGKVQFSTSGYLSESPASLDTDVEVQCQGYGGSDTANISNVAVSCFMMVGPPTRTDHGDPKMSELNSAWSQTIHYCASATRARIQTVTFSFNGTSDLKDLQISRSNNDTALLWASEKTDFTISVIDAFWGRVADSYENDPTLWTLRSDHFYAPAGASGEGFTGPGTPQDNPQTILGISWFIISDPTSTIIDYSGTTDFALLDKWRSTIQTDPMNGPSHIINSIWTDLVANNLMGSDTSTTLSVARRHKTVAYDFKYAIPAFILLALWFPTFLGAVFILAFGRVRLSYLRYLLNQTSVGRIVVGDSALVVMGHSGQVPTPGEESNTAEIPVLETFPERKEKSRVPTAVWAKTAGQTPLGFAPVEEAPGVSGSSTEADSVLSHDRETGTGDLPKNGGSIRRRLRKVLAEMVSDSPSVSSSEPERTVSPPMLERASSRDSGRMSQGDQSRT